MAQVDYFHFTPSDRVLICLVGNYYAVPKHVFETWRVRDPVLMKQIETVANRVKQRPRLSGNNWIAA